MIVHFAVGGADYVADLDHPLDISIPLRFDGSGPNAFHLPAPDATVAEGGDFVGDTRRGGSCNCETVRLNPHGNGTHTECAGHLLRERLAVRDALRSLLVPSLLVSVEPEVLSSDGERAVTRRGLEQALARVAEPFQGFTEGLIIRTLPNDPEKQERVWSGSNPPYIGADAIELVRELGVEHLVLDLPSVDREDDPELTAHRLFWSMGPERELPDEARHRTITEMVYIDDDMTDGRYLLQLGIPPFMLDAAPSRPMMVRISAG